MLNVHVALHGHIQGLYVTHVLHTARISKSESVLCVDKERYGKHLTPYL